MISADAKPPMIIGVGLSKSSIDNYYIQLDGHLIPNPSSLSFLKVVDAVFQLHFIFNIEFEINLKHFWLFIQKCIYKMEINVSANVHSAFFR